LARIWPVVGVKIDAVDDKTLWRLDDPAGAMPTVAVP